MKWQIILPTLTLILGATFIMLTRPVSTEEKQDDFRFVPPPPHLEKFTFGYRDTSADIIWVRLLQDFHICENVKGGIAHVEGEVREGPACRRGWVFHMLDAITDLAPSWKLPFRAGATLLSVVVDDIEGATVIFEKGLKQFPYDYNINYAAAYHYLYEVKNQERAAELLIQAAKSGGPQWLYSLAGKLYSESGRAVLAKGVLEEALSRPQSDEVKARLQKRLDEANKTLQAEANKKSN